MDMVVNFHGASDTYNSLAEITPLEHACCPFFDIGIRIEVKQ